MTNDKLFLLAEHFCQNYGSIDLDEEERFFLFGKKVMDACKTEIEEMNENIVDGLLFAAAQKLSGEGEV